MFSMSISVF